MGGGPSAPGGAGGAGRCAPLLLRQLGVEPDAGLSPDLAPPEGKCGESRQVARPWPGGIPPRLRGARPWPWPWLPVALAQTVPATHSPELAALQGRLPGLWLPHSSQGGGGCPGTGLEISPGGGWRGGRQSWGCIHLVSRSDMERWCYRQAPACAPAPQPRLDHAPGARAPPGSRPGLDKLPDSPLQTASAAWHSTARHGAGRELCPHFPRS